MNLILFGFKGAGKTHFGKLLSIKMHRPFIDTDHLILELYTKQTGKKKTITEIYKELKEEGFRSLEKQTFEILKDVKNSIIALGGGFVLDPENIEKLELLGSLVYLKASVQKLKERIFKDELPAFLAKDDPEQAFLDMYHEREPIYRSIKARCVDTDILDEPGVLAALNSIFLLES
jgi:shikimate kinase